MNVISDAAQQLARIGLTDVEETTALDTRIDRKYLITDEVAADLIAELAHRSEVLDIDGRISFDYRSEYFDTPTLDLHRDAAHRRRRRFKVRTRLYAHMDSAVLEVKEKHLRGHTVKHRCEHDVADLLELGIDDKAFIASIVGDRSEIDELQPTLTTRYERITVVDPESATRLTIDRGVRADSADGRNRVLAGSIIETKSPLAPGPADRWLWRHGIRPVRFSKYCTMLAELHPDLPRNKWHRTLRRIQLVTD